MAGVVRRDGLRDELARVLVDWFGAALAFDSATDYETLDAGKAAARVWVERELLDAVLDAVPDVPPDPPAAEADLETRVAAARKRIENGLTLSPDVTGNFVYVRQSDVLRVFDDFLSGVLVDAADVRARALEDAAEELFYDGDTDRPLPGYTALLDRAVSERDRGTT